MRFIQSIDDENHPHAGFRAYTAIIALSTNPEVTDFSRRDSSRVYVPLSSSNSRTYSSGCMTFFSLYFFFFFFFFDFVPSTTWLFTSGFCIQLSRWCVLLFTHPCIYTYFLNGNWILYGERCCTLKSFVRWIYRFLIKHFLTKPKQFVTWFLQEGCTKVHPPRKPI